MTITFKITRKLLGAIRADLVRPHPFAYERVGFVSASLSASSGNLLVLARAYRPVDDKDYLPDPSVGAMMGPEAIRKAMEWALVEKVALFHVHTHGGCGYPGFSGIDLRDQPKVATTLFQTARKCPHGAIVLSNDKAVGNIWLYPDRPGVPITRFLEVGAPLESWTIDEPV